MFNGMHGAVTRRCPLSLRSVGRLLTGKLLQSITYRCDGEPQVERSAQRHSLTHHSDTASDLTPIDMQPSQSSNASHGAHSGVSSNASLTSTRGAIAPRSRAKKPAAPDPNQPTLQQIFARAAVKPSGAAAAATGATDPPPASLSSARAPTTSQPAVASCPVVHPEVLSPRVPRCVVASPVDSPGPWRVEREVISLRRPATTSPFTSPVQAPRPAAAAAVASTAVETIDLTSPLSPELIQPTPASGVASGRSSPYIPYSSQPESVPGSAAEPFRETSTTTTTTTIDTSWLSQAHQADERACAPAAAAAVAAGPADHEREVETLAARLARMRMRSAGTATSTSTGAGAVTAAMASGSVGAMEAAGGCTSNIQMRPLQAPLWVQQQQAPPPPPPQKQQQLQQPQLVPSASVAATGRLAAAAAAAAAAPGPSHAAEGSSVGGGDAGERASVTARDDDRTRNVSTTWPASTTPAVEAVSETQPSWSRRAGVSEPAAAAALGGPPAGVPAAREHKPAAGREATGSAVGTAGMGAEAAPPDVPGSSLGPASGAAGAAAGRKASGRARAGAKAKAGRSGKAPGGALLWTELSPEEREDADGRAWIRWEPLAPLAPRDGDEEGGSGSGPGPLYHLFSVDIETVDFMRGRQAFPRPDQVRLLEVAAVDLGPYDLASEGTDPRVGVGPAGGRVFSTLVNCGRSFKAHKTILHNGITWAESSAPGVPGTTEALQRLFGFISQRCAATAVAAAEAARSAAAAGGSSRSGGAAGDEEEPAFPKVIPVLMAHNGSAFDFPVLRSECGRVGVEWPQNWWYFDTLLAAKVLWAKADWPTRPADGDDPLEDEGEEEGPDAAGNGAAAGGGGKKSLSMDALKLWAGVTSNGQAHRAEVDAVDLAGVWVKLFERWGSPRVDHLARLCSARGTTKPAAGPMHRLGLVSLAARADGLVRHVEVAVGNVLRPTPPHSQAAVAASAASASAGCLVLSPTQLRELAEGERIHLRKPRGGADGFWFFEVLGQRPVALPEMCDNAGGGAAGGAAGSATAAAPSLAPIVVLLRGVKLRYMAKASYGYKTDHTPKWDMVLAAAATGKAGSGGEGASTAEEVSELVIMLDNLARHASLEARGDAGRSARLYSCGKDDGNGKSGRKVITAQLHAQLSRGPAPGQLRWEPRATLATYDKKLASYKSLTWPPLESYTPESAGHVSFSGQSELDRVKEDNLARVMAQLPDVASSEVLDVALWPEFCWVNNTGCGVRLKAVHLVRRASR